MWLFCSLNRRCAANRPPPPSPVYITESQVRLNYFINLSGAVSGGLEVSGGNARVSVHEARCCKVCDAPSEYLQACTLFMQQSCRQFMFMCLALCQEAENVI